MRHITIKEPIWRPTPAVGISEEYEQDMEITISHKKANGELMYPDKYFIEWDRLKYYKPKNFGKRGMPPVRIVPISMLETIKQL